MIQKLKIQLNPFCPDDPKIITRGTEEPRPMSNNSLRLQRSILWIFHIPPFYVVGCFFNSSSLFSNEMKRKTTNQPEFFLENEFVGWLAPWTLFHLNRVNLKHPLQIKEQGTFFGKYDTCVSWVATVGSFARWEAQFGLGAILKPLLAISSCIILYSISDPIW